MLLSNLCIDGSDDQSTSRDQGQHHRNGDENEENAEYLPVYSCWVVITVTCTWEGERGFYLVLQLLLS